MARDMSRESFRGRDDKEVADICIFVRCFELLALLGSVCLNLCLASLSSRSETLSMSKSSYQFRSWTTAFQVSIFAFVRFPFAVVRLPSIVVTIEDFICCIAMWFPVYVSVLVLRIYCPVCSECPRCIKTSSLLSVGHGYLKLCMAENDFNCCMILEMVDLLGLWDVRNGENGRFGLMTRLRRQSVRAPP